MADFPYKPDFKYKVKPRFNVETSQFENKVEEARLITSKKLRRIELSATARLEAEIEVIKAFFDSKYENLISFTLDLEGETLTGKFEPGSFWYSKVSAGVYEYGFNFQEVP